MKVQSQSKKMIRALVLTLLLTGAQFPDVTFADVQTNLDDGDQSHICSLLDRYLARPDSTQGKWRTELESLRSTCEVPASALPNNESRMNFMIKFWHTIQMSYIDVMYSTPSDKSKNIFQQIYSDAYPIYCEALSYWGP